MLARPCTSSKQYPLSHYISTNHLVPKYKAFTTALSNTFEPKFYDQTIKYLHWKEGMNSEIKALEMNNIWTFMHLLYDKHTIGSKCL